MDTYFVLPICFPNVVWVNFFSVGYLFPISILACALPSSGPSLQWFPWPIVNQIALNSLCIPCALAEMQFK